jgi:hypothetical protein
LITAVGFLVVAAVAAFFPVTRVPPGAPFVALAGGWLLITGGRWFVHAPLSLLIASLAAAPGAAWLENRAAVALAEEKRAAVAATTQQREREAALNKHREKKEAERAVRELLDKRGEIEKQLVTLEGMVARKEWKPATVMADSIDARVKPAFKGGLPANPDVERIQTRLARQQQLIAKEREADQAAARASLEASAAALRAYYDANASADLELASHSWHKSAFDTVAIWSVRIRNTSRVAEYYDIEYSTDYSAPSGTHVRSSSGKILDSVRSGQSRSFEVNDGFVPSQAGSASFKITGASKRPAR